MAVGAVITTGAITTDGSSITTVTADGMGEIDGTTTITTTIIIGTDLTATAGGTATGIGIIATQQYTGVIQAAWFATTTVTTAGRPLLLPCPFRASTHIETPIPRRVPATPFNADKLA